MDWTADSDLPLFKTISSSLLILCFLITSGCVSAAIDKVEYKENQISVGVENPNTVSDTTLQVTIYQIVDFHQQEITTIWNTSKVNQGSSTIILPQHLESGTYKLYVYLIQNGERKTAVIKDIEVKPT